MAITFPFFIDLIIKWEMADKLPIKNGSIAMKFWKKPPVPVSFNIYVFDIINPDEILAGTEVPAVIEKGPYVYTMHIEKTDIKWHDNGTVEYIQPQTFVFNREASVGPDTDTFTTINIPYITVATVLQYEFPFIQKAVDAFFTSKGEGTFMTKSVYDIWWGYEDPVLEEAAKVLHKFNISSPLLNGKFGFYMDRNNTGDGLYNVYSGADGNFDNYVMIDRWNGLRNLTIWKSDYANAIRGTDGSMQPPFIDTSKNLSIFDAYLHRSLKLVYNSTSSYRDIRTLRYYVPYSEFAAPSENPDNAGFCTPDINSCIPSGAYNLSEATYFAPMYVSFPHFIGGDPYYQRQVKGLKPSQVLHQPFYDIHELTGVSMRAARRYQIVLRSQSYEYFTKFKTFPVAYLPILWIDGMAAIDPDTAALLKHLIQDPLDAMPGVRAGVFAASAVLFIVTVGLFIFWKRKSKKDFNRNSEDSEREPLIKSTSNEISPPSVMNNGHVADVRTNSTQVN